MTTHNKNIPALRFPEFNGEWTSQPLNEFLAERNEQTEESLPLYSLTIESGIVPKSKRYERSFLVKSEKDAYKVMLKNDFAFNPMNLRFGALARHKGEEKVLERLRFAYTVQMSDI
jgi:type I restriction enzyme S subunit